MMWIDEAADFKDGVMQGATFEEHYEEKALAPNQRLSSGRWDMAVVDEVPMVGVDYASVGGQTSVDSKHLRNLKKERAWSRKEGKRLPPWMRAKR